MHDRIRAILSWCASENPGTRTNLARLLNSGRLGGTGKLVILPVGQGFEHGPARSFAPEAQKLYQQYEIPLATPADWVRHVIQSTSKCRSFLAFSERVLLIH